MFVQSGKKVGTGIREVPKQGFHHKCADTDRINKREGERERDPNKNQEGSNTTGDRSETNVGKTTPQHTKHTVKHIAKKIVPRGGN